LWIGFKVILRLSSYGCLLKVEERRAVRIQDIWSGGRVREVPGKIWSSGIRENVEVIWGCGRVREVFEVIWNCRPSGEIHEEMGGPEAEVGSIHIVPRMAEITLNKKIVIRGKWFREALSR